ncbi:conserved hypothetical protein [Vibrio crassostreae]|uniref:hypothetical protein n=1 Tax=Vibrio crassostreae TaxID=246167 RepID=UPI0005E7C03A|nr:hypothetical protein [Vibrio crassostreae]CAK1713518.1 conserved hypothetical protein [Vibrio crassostreae]CAK2150390.1 conserved hypothetical protein [Vibrio crassostreae]CAK2166250.1 conserved hypothetical protein [Vibrio crassostreae]CAK2264753.1 conserved hypothetical protein [Vibrio crassostreae]CAK3075506.1 conserved hypothetical protein [Vibrio crassostreae]
MKQLQTLSPGESIQFNAGQAGKYLIIREASHSLMLRGDALRPTEIGRGDTVDITRFDELELFNHQAEPVTVEYQVADIPISTKSQNIDINNSVTISEILTPITVSAVQAEVKTRIQNDKLTVKKLADLYTLQKVDTGYLDLTGDEQSIAGNEERKGLFIQTYQDNDRSVLVQGFIEVVAGGHVLIKSNEAITLEGVAGDGVRIGEFI